MTSNLQLQLEAGKTYENWGSYNDGTTFDLVPVDSSSTTSSWYSCSTDGACAFNNNTPKTGGYYSWYAATGGKGLASSTGDINGSICPKGWKLPYNYTVDNNKSYQTLVNKYKATYAILEAVPLTFSRSGHYYTGTYDAASPHGHWSSTAVSSSNAYDLQYTQSQGINSQASSRKLYGFYVRCVNV